MAELTHWEGEPVEVWRRLWNLPRLEIHEEIGSTNDRGKALARDPQNVGSVILAEAQTRGRGRGNRSWVSTPEKGLLFSVLLEASESEKSTLAPVRMGLAVADAIEASAVEEGAPGPKIGLKWPNDLMIGDRKVGGILCELAGKGILVAGVGLNVYQVQEDFPMGLQGGATSLEMSLGIHLSRGLLMGRILREIGVLSGGRGRTLAPGELMAYGARDCLKGRRIVSETGGEGRGMGLSPEGHLLLGTDDGGLCRVRAGSVRLENMRRERS